MKTGRQGNQCRWESGNYQCYLGGGPGSYFPRTMIWGTDFPSFMQMFVNRTAHIVGYLSTNHRIHGDPRNGLVQSVSGSTFTVLRYEYKTRPREKKRNATVTRQW